ncbi:MAG: protein kinase, partial [Verrucomicrobia bacterium]|nr:protein kinase [Verrucomicrobiota bacterium]
MNTDLHNVIPDELRGAQAYRFGDIIARGGMGAVLKAEDEKLNRTVAMKVVLRGTQASPESLRRFIQEAHVLGQLEHPNIVPIHELAVDSVGQPYYTMKLVHGVTLRDVLQGIHAGDAATIKRYPLDQLLVVYQKVCDAIAFAHSRGVIHRDLKPDNIMLGNFGEVLVMDWGLAKILPGSPIAHVASAQAEFAPDSSSEMAFGEAPARNIGDSLADAMTLEGEVMGTPHFMAPEQAEGRIHDLDERTDVFSLGGILYSILTLSRPVTGSTLQEVLSNIRRGYIAPPALYNKVRTAPKAAERYTADDAEPMLEHAKLRHLPDGRVPDALSAVVMKAMAVAPSRRYQNVAELQRDITAYQSGFATSAEEAGLVRQLLLLVRRHKTLTISAVFILTLSGFFAAEIISGERKARASLEQLRATAPTFHDQARTLIEQADLSDALEKIDFALALSPSEPQFLITKANILQTMRRLDDARAAYARMLELDPASQRAQINLRLCDELKQKSKGGTDWPAEALKFFNNELVKQGRSAEALYLSRFLLKDGEALYKAWKARLAAAGIQPRRMELLPSGRFKLDLRGLPIDDLSPLKTMPLERLDVEGTRIVNLGPLEGMGLSQLVCSRTRVASLDPLREMPLTHLEAGETEVGDLEPLRGMHLETLVLRDTKVRDLAPLAGMPLRQLDLVGCVEITDLGPVRQCTNLIALGVPPNVKDFSPLRVLPALKTVSFQRNIRVITETTEEFLRQIEAGAAPPRPGMLPPGTPMPP